MGVEKYCETMSDNKVQDDIEADAIVRKETGGIANIGDALSASLEQGFPTWGNSP